MRRGGEILHSWKLQKIPENFSQSQNPHYLGSEKLVKVDLARGISPDVCDLWRWQFRNVAKNAFKLFLIQKTTLTPCKHERIRKGDCAYEDRFEELQPAEQHVPA